MRWLARLMNRSVNVREHAGLSGSWETCAVGEAHHDLPGIVVYDRSVLVFNDPGAPADRVLHRLGSRFHSEVSAGHRNKALEVYQQIQQRIGQLARAAAKKRVR